MLEAKSLGKSRINLFKEKCLKHEADSVKNIMLKNLSTDCGLWNSPFWKVDIDHHPDKCLFIVNSFLVGPYLPPLVFIA